MSPFLIQARISEKKIKNTRYVLLFLILKCIVPYMVMIGK